MPASRIHASNGLLRDERAPPQAVHIQAHVRVTAERALERRWREAPFDVALYVEECSSSVGNRAGGARALSQPALVIVATGETRTHEAARVVPVSLAREPREQGLIPRKRFANVVSVAFAFDEGEDLSIAHGLHSLCRSFPEALVSTASAAFLGDRLPGVRARGRVDAMRCGARGFAEADVICSNLANDHEVYLARDTVEVAEAHVVQYKGTFAESLLSAFGHDIRRARFESKAAVKHLRVRTSLGLLQTREHRALSAREPFL
mmetsp:Transcript_2844/g.11412  ORF Transcript_2844/g.11412 Transcript_2844/m.11412 type:complete len:263 (+) Transcript_2844:407-1195(+)